MGARLLHCIALGKYHSKYQSLYKVLIFLADIFLRLQRAKREPEMTQPVLDKIPLKVDFCYAWVTVYYGMRLGILL